MLNIALEIDLELLEFWRSNRSPSRAVFEVLSCDAAMIERAVLMKYPLERLLERVIRFDSVKFGLGLDSQVHSCRFTRVQ